ncbi:MAG: hypothetical protein KIS92_22760, partial [Planctomycetota bacterium]|nr:hypothetical protein [Planctomycetota bacterium]
TAVLLVAGVVLIGGGIFLAMRSGGENFEALRQKALDEARPALKESGAKLAGATGALQSFVQHNADRSIADLQPVTELLEQLKTRGTALAQREANFKEDLAEAARLGKEQKTLALEKLGEAEALGHADASKGYPDLLAGLAPSMQERRAELEGTAAPAQPSGPADPLAEARYKGEMEAAERSFGSRNYEGAEARFQAALREKPGDAAAAEGLKKIAAAREALAKPDAKTVAAPKNMLALMAQVMEAKRAGNWQRVSDLLEEASHRGNLSDEAERLLAQARTNLRNRGTLDDKLKEGEAALARRDYDGALAAFKAAQAFTPDEEQAARLNKGIQQANAGQADAKVAAEMDAAKAAIDSRNFAGAMKHLQAALEMRPNDPVILDAIARTKQVMQGNAGGGEEPGGGPNGPGGQGPGPNGPGPGGPPPRRR